MKLTIIKKAVSSEFECVICGGTKLYNKKNQWCKKCYDHDYNVNRRDKAAERLRQAWLREKNFENYVLARTKSKAKRESWEFDLDLVWVTAELAKGKCAVTNMPTVKPTYKPGKIGNQGQWSPSIDRIDNSKGYTKENCRVVVWMYNLAKNNYGDNEIVKMSLALATTLLLKMNNVNANPALDSFLKGVHQSAITV